MKQYARRLDIFELELKRSYLPRDSEHLLELARAVEDADELIVDQEQKER